MPFQDNHMDELFQRAAENFPLKEPDDHWNAIQSRLDVSGTPDAAINRKRPIVLFGLLAIMCLHLPFLLFDTVYHHETGVNGAVFGKNGEQDEFQQNHKEIGNEEVNTTNNLIHSTASEENIFNYARASIADARQKSDHSVQEYNKYKIKTKSADSTTNNQIILQPVQDNGQQVVLENDQVKTPEPNTTTNTEQLADATTTTDLLTDTIVPKIAKNTLNKRASGFYAGLNTGISLSIVKGQQLSSPGFTAGINLGYRFSPSWSAETGIKFSEKKYYSTGAYFSSKDMPPDMKVVSVKSRTLLLEIPLKAKVDFRKTVNGQYFLTGGFSTFVVGKEVNDYIIYRNGINSPMHAVYDKNKSYLAASIELSAGYEKYFKNKQSLRIEPWIQIARKGIGIGQLPVSGFGIQAGYFFHK